jgi:hypothetical protein
LATVAPGVVVIGWLDMVTPNTVAAE